MPLRLFFIFVFMLAATVLARAESPVPEFGDDTGKYAKDGECEDRRFVGFGMSSYISQKAVKHDATDCKRLYDAGQIKLVDPQKGKSLTICSQINFGDNSSEYANDGECDDPRFDGLGADVELSLEDLVRDKNDCKAMCEKGAIWLRVPKEAESN